MQYEIDYEIDRVLLSPSLPGEGFRERFLSLQFFHRIPELFMKIYYFIIFHDDTFIFKQLLHGGGITKMVLSGKQPVPVDYPVGRDKVGSGVTGIKCPADHSC